MKQIRCFFSRLKTVMKVSRHASQALATTTTALVSIVLIPLCDVLFSLLMGISLQSDNVVRIGYASTLVGMAVTAMSFINQSLVYARWVGVLQDISLWRGSYPIYWLGISCWAALAALGMGLVPLTASFAFDPSHNGQLLLTAFAAAPFSILVGLSLGILTSAAGLIMNDPYALSNALAFILPLTAGSIVPLTSYPGSWGKILLFFPLSALVGILTGSASWGWGIGLNLGYALAGAGCGFLFLHLSARLLRSGRLKPIQ